MEEKILQTKKNGMVMLLLTLLGYAVTVLLFFYSIILLDESLFPGILLTILSIAYWVAGIFLLCGLKVLKPQEALVLTLFGDYIGTLKGQGFYWVNPFCTAVNPAAGTKLSQSGDVNSGETGMAALLKAGNSSSQTAESTSKKISLKMMTLNNSRQKINDCLGNPVEIGIKEYLSVAMERPSRRKLYSEEKREAYPLEQTKTTSWCRCCAGCAGAGSCTAFCGRKLAGKAQPKAGDPDGAAAGDR